MYSSSLRNSSTSFDLLGDLYHINISIRFSSTAHKNIFEADEKIFFRKIAPGGVQEFFEKNLFPWLRRYYDSGYSRIVN